jgi:methylated-DNA-[protein]-cysteine S-methyltransferase
VAISTHQQKNRAMTNPLYTLFDTPIGRCGLAWDVGGIIAVQLPQPTQDQTVKRLLQRHQGVSEAPPDAAVSQAIAAMVDLLSGKPIDLHDVAIDLTSVPALNRKVYDLTRAVSPGKTTTYGEIAKALGGLELAREVGQALGRNPCPLIVPCHRVLAAGDKPGGFSANGGVVTKLRLLEIEGAIVNYTPSLFD